MQMVTLQQKSESCKIMKQLQLTYLEIRDYGKHFDSYIIRELGVTDIETCINEPLNSWVRFLHDLFKIKHFVYVRIMCCENRINIRK
jgi:hypothetical protein